MVLLPPPAASRAAKSGLKVFPPPEELSGSWTLSGIEGLGKKVVDALAALHREDA